MKTLGLDINTSGIAYSLYDDISLDIFGAGMLCYETDLECRTKNPNDTGSSKNRKRRECRSRRRQVARTKQRKRNLLNYLAKINFIPFDKISNSNSEVQSWNNLMSSNTDKPYSLLLRAIKGDISIQEFCKVLYFYTGHRGFKSSRKGNIENSDDGVIKKSISEMKVEMLNKNFKTLGEYFNSFSSHEKGYRSGNFYLDREMVCNEIETIFNAVNFPKLTEKVKEDIRKIIFFQRKLKSQKSLVGKCELEKNSKRCLKAYLIYQEFKCFEQINRIRIVEDKEERLLTDNEREFIYQKLKTYKEYSFSSLEKDLKVITNYHDIKNEKLKGNETSISLRKAIGEKWDEYSDIRKDNLVEFLVSFENEEKLVHSLMNGKWRFSQEEANNISKIAFNYDYAKYSRKAIVKLLPFLKMGLTVIESVNKVYNKVADEYNAQLLDRDMKYCKNRVVHRNYHNFKKMMDKIIQQYGVPDEIRVEMAREFGTTQKKREQIYFENKIRENENKKIEQQLFARGIKEPSNYDRKKMKLFNEQNDCCLYCGSVVDYDTSHVDHILPQSRTIDNSPNNLALGCQKCNDFKNNRTPYEAWGETDRWQEIVFRARKYYSKNRTKLNAVLREDGGEKEFGGDQLPNTNYSAKAIIDYLRYNFGKTTKIRNNYGKAVGEFRRIFGLNNILGYDEKNRYDLRHHVLDAIVVSLMDQKTITKMKYEIRNLEQYHFKSNRGYKIIHPLDGFCGYSLFEHVREKVMSVIIQHEIRHKINGQLFAETNYGQKNHNGEDKYTTRVALNVLTPENINKIIDKSLREKIRTEWNNSGCKTKKSNNKTVIVMPNKIKDHAGRDIKKIKIEAYVKKLLRIKNQNVGSEENWCFVVLKNDENKYRSVCISRYEAILNNGIPQHIVKNNEKIEFILFKNDTIKFENEHWVVCGISKTSDNTQELKLKKHFWRSYNQKDKNNCKRITSFKDIYKIIHV